MQHVFQPPGEHLSLKGVSTNNLKNIDIDLPKNQIITITGVSGSGKSSLAFDTIYKEGQFRYIESLSSYLRQFFNLGEKPDIESSYGLSPAIAIEQNKRVGNSRSTVGTLTEIDDYLRLLYAKLGKAHCYNCNRQIKAHSVETIMNDMYDKFEDRKVYFLQDIGNYADSRDFLKFVKRNRSKMEKGDGYTRYLVVMQEGVVEYFYLESPNIPEKFYPVSVYGIFDRVTINQENHDRAREDIVKLLNEGVKFGIYESLEQDSVEDKASMKIGKDVYNTGTSGITWYTDKIYCPNCDITYPEFTTQYFSPNRIEGACTVCHGLGEVLDVDLNKMIDPNSPLLEAVLPWKDSSLGQQILTKMAQKYGQEVTKRWGDLPEYFTKVLIDGDGEVLRIAHGGKFTSMNYNGLEDILTSQYNKGILGVDFQAMLSMKACDSCHGQKLRRESLHVFLEASSLPSRAGPGISEKQGRDTKIPGQARDDKQQTRDDKSQKSIAIPGITRYNIADLWKLPIEKLIPFLEGFKETTTDSPLLIERITHPLLERAKTIQHLGLRYLNLSRQMDTLSGGEIQRLRLAKQLGNKLTGIIYVLDEPTIGLDDVEIARVIESIRSLKAMGNTIVVVEHNEEFIKASDWVVEIGPGAGEFGGQLIFSGPYDDFVKTDTLTAQYVTGRKAVSINFDHKPMTYELVVRGAHEHNLNVEEARVRLGSFTIITGPSGAGKTTLMYHTMFKFLDERAKFSEGFIRLKMMASGASWQQIMTRSAVDKDQYLNWEEEAIEEFFKTLKVKEISGYSHVHNTIYVDQASIGKTPRSCPATFIGVFDNIRNLFAGAQDSKLMGFTSGHFSFNSNKGACPECDGYGYKKIELQFLPDTYVPCPLCRGKRYKPEILSIRWHGKTISDVLEMYVHEAHEFFSDVGWVSDELKLMVDIGLGYLKMGQAAHTLSGGESQRIKLVKHLLKQYKGHTIYFLDEPTVGLHPEDIQKLLIVIKHFLQRGDTILMIEHDKSLLQFADDVIRLRQGVVE